MSGFGDADPEDAWDDGDSIAIKLLLLSRIASELRAGAHLIEFRRVDALRLIAKMEAHGQGSATLTDIRLDLEQLGEH